MCAAARCTLALARRTPQGEEEDEEGGEDEEEEEESPPPPMLVMKTTKGAAKAKAIPNGFRKGLTLKGARAGTGAPRAAKAKAKPKAAAKATPPKAAAKGKAAAKAAAAKTACKRPAAALPKSSKKPAADTEAGAGGEGHQAVLFDLPNIRVVVRICSCKCRRKVLTFEHNPLIQANMCSSVPQDAIRSGRKSSARGSPTSHRACKTYGRRSSFPHMCLQTEHAFGTRGHASAQRDAPCAISRVHMHLLNRKRALQSMSAPSGLKRNLQTSIINAAVMNMDGRWSPATEDSWATNNEQTPLHLNIWFLNMGVLCASLRNHCVYFWIAQDQLAQNYNFQEIFRSYTEKYDDKKSTGTHHVDTCEQITMCEHTAALLSCSAWCKENA